MDAWRFELPRQLLGLYRHFAPTERGGYRLCRAARALLPHSQWAGRFTTPDGLHLDLDLGTYPDTCMAYGLYELDTARLLRKRLGSGRAKWFIDCGANLGYFTLLAHRCMGPEARIDAIEPDPANRGRLLRHIAANAAERVRVHEFAAGEGPGELTLYHPDPVHGNHGQSSAYIPPALADSHTLVRVASLPEQFPEGVPDLIKMDIEGAELAALRGMRPWLASDRPPALIIEHNPATAAAAGFRPGDLFREITTAQPRYQAFEIAWRLRPIRSGEQMDRMARQCNVLFVCSASRQ